MLFVRFPFGFINSLLCFVILSEESETSDEADRPGCNKIRTFGYGYKSHLFHLSETSLHSPLFGGDFFFEFMVRAPSDAHVLLTPSSSVETSYAVYEIVIGSDGNTQSDLRRGRLKNSKDLVWTTGILSPTEMRGFWIRINKEGLIQVGNDGNSVPFMSWQDPEPVAVQYFSFGSWYNVKADWLFGCSQTNDPEFPVQPNLTNMGQLRQHLLTNYDPYVRPASDPHVLLPVHIGLTVYHIELDTKQSRMMVHGSLPVMWYDDKMHWNPEDYENLTELHLKDRKIWQPKIILYNAVGHGGSPLGTSSMIVSYNGRVMWRPPVHLKSRCFLDLSSWPWDTQMCTLQFGFLPEKDSLQLMFAENSTQLASEITSSEWTVITLETETTEVRTPWLQGSDEMSETPVNNTSLTYKFTIQRISTVYCYMFILPLLDFNSSLQHIIACMILLSLLTFWISPLRNEKLAIHCISLFSLCVFILKLEDILPATSDRTPYLLKAYTHVTIVVAVSTVLSVVIINLSRNSHFKPPHKLICILIRSRIVKGIFCLPDVKCENETNSGGDEAATRLEENSLVNQYWGLLAVTIDRITFFILILYFIDILIP